MLHNKRAFQLSINMIVVMILGLALLGVGISIFYNAYNKTVDLKENVDSQTQRQLSDLLDSGEAIVIPINSKEVDRGEYVDFDLGISNELGSPRVFFLYVRFDSYVGRNVNSLENDLNAEDVGSLSCRPSTTLTEQNCADKWILFPKESSTSTGSHESDKFRLNNNDRHTVPLRFVLPKRILINTNTRTGLPSGQYIFNVDVYSTDCDNPVSTCTCTDFNGCSQYFSRKKIYIKVK